ncbi:hypothetical protein AGMMS49525_11900 [Bacteroidia bacterium]|nr:hypothetical protein AGMMS49525_11900 [Bacteroidia bacterium]
MKQHDMTKWLKKMFLFLLPFLVLLTLYVVLDPFKVVRKYSGYDDSAEVRLVLNRDYVSTCTFENNYPSHNYDSFIFGNSCSIFYEVADWKCYLDSNSRCFHFDASGESLYGAYKKIKYLDAKGVKMNNVLFVVDYSLLEQVKPSQAHLRAISPQLEGNKNALSFQLSFLKAFFTPKFVLGFFDYKIFGKLRRYMLSLLDARPTRYEADTNEISYPHYEQLIAQDEYYTSERMSVFYERDSVQSFFPLVIKASQKKMLREINDIVRKNNADLKVIISPRYDQKKLDKQDLMFVQSLFGQERVFDFSGINDLTNDYTNYYEAMHYRPHVARVILKEVYFRTTASK